MAANQVGKIIQDGTVKYQLIDIIGHGTYGSIYLGRRCTPPHTLYAVKCLPKHASGSRQASIQRQEITIHTSLGHHPNITSLEFVFHTRDYVYIGMEYCEGGDLYETITTSKGPGFGSSSTKRNALIKQAFLHILRAVEYCHSKGVYHRDIKPENILISGDGLLKLADFGLATTEQSSCEFGCGSSFYMSPESQLSSRSKFNSSTFSNYSPAASDVWALGIILINLCFGRNPWKQATLSDPTFAAYFRDQTVLLEMFPLTQEGADILYQVLEVNPNRRCSLQKLLMMVQLVEGFVEEEFEEADDMTEQVPQYHSSCETVKKVYSEDSVCIEIEHIDYVASDFIQNSNIAYPEAKIVVNTWEELSEINPSNTKTRMESKNVLAAPPPPSSKTYKTALSTVKGKNTPKSDPEYSNCSTPSRSDSYTSWSSITTDTECTSPMMFVEHNYKNDSMFKNHATADFQSGNKNSINSSSLPKNDREVVEYHHSPSPRYSPWFHLYKSEYVQLTPKERQPVCRQKIRVRNSSEDGTLEDGYQFTEFEDCYDNVETMFELTSSDKVPRSDCCFCLG